jgi:sigma-B regulation protein RsbU (phosphoserine phosphatase)
MHERLIQDVTAALASPLALEEALHGALAVVTRELQVARGAFFVRSEGHGLVLGASCGLLAAAPSTLPEVEDGEDVRALGPGDEAHDRHGLALLVPIHHRGRAIAALGLGPRDGAPYGPEDHAFLRSVAACAATPIENGLLREELQRAHRKLSLQAFELHSLIDVSRDLARGSSEEAVRNLVTTSLMGHFLVSRCAVYLDGPHGLSLAHGRGLGRERRAAAISPEEARLALDTLAEPLAVVELPEGPLRRLLLGARMALAVPLRAGDRVEGVLAIGERASGMPFTPGDREVAQAMARQALGALENARLQRVREEKLRQDRELQIARDIQQSLFPPHPPEVPGFDVAAESRPCFEVGGDSYDWIPLGGGRLALVIADVSGKGTPASLLMASVHAFVHALAGTAEPARVVEQLNRFLFARTQASRFVTLFYAELDPSSRRLTYVNAGHVPPYRVDRDGTVSRLEGGGPALGLLPEGSYGACDVSLERGDTVALVTDGLTEAWSQEDQEFGDERVGEALRRLAGRSARAVLRGLVAAVDQWAGDRAFSDDRTTLILRAD